jgi:NAD(P)H-dependent FMN reductase
MKKFLLLILLVLSTHLAAEVKVLAFAGSTREGSCNKKLAAEAAQIARQMGAKVTLIDLKDYPMPFYDADLEASKGMPVTARRFRQLMIESNAIIIASPNYNGSFTAVLKNALDWASRGESGGASREAFKGKKFALLSTSPGRGGGASGLAQLRVVIEDIGGEVIKPQVSVPGANSAFDTKGRLVNASAKRELLQEIQQLFRSKS